MNPTVSQPWWHHLPIVNATLNGLSAVLLMSAFIMIHRRRVTAHATLMICAFVTSTVFLACYLLYHTIKAQHQDLVTRFPPGGWRPVYLTILGTHTVAAIVILPLIFSSLYLAARRRWRSHRRVSNVTFPLWFYVSVTGVVVYFMLYHLAPTLRH